jgi:hypothetical protein
MSNDSYQIIDTPTFSGLVNYRFTCTVHPDYWLYLNRDYNLDSDGDAGPDGLAEYRCSSTFIAKEIF